MIQGLAPQKQNLLDPTVTSTKPCD
jgi:hypothetical protein